MKLLSIVGARPQFIKLAPVSREIQRRVEQGEAVDEIIVHTGQHYDPGMSDIFFAELEIPRAHHHLEVGSGSHGRQTGLMLEHIEGVLEEVRPGAVVIYGDTNSTIAGALAAAKLHIPVAHVEAGLRSFNRRMPEEINRIASDHISDLLLAPTPMAVRNLEREGLGDRTVNTGDIMYDAILFNRALAARKSRILESEGLDPGGYGLVTVHRAENTDDPERLRILLQVFNEIVADGLKLVFPVHPRTRNTIDRILPQWRPGEGLRLLDPVGYLDIIRLAENAAMVLTDSGGLQKEAFFLGTPCVTLRDETEWVETVEYGGNVVAGVSARGIQEAVEHWRRTYPRGRADFSAGVSAAFGQGDAAKRILGAISERLF